MLVSNWMSKKVVTVDEQASMQEAIKLMRQHDIRMLPVIRRGKLVGIVTDRDLKRASASDATTLEIHELLYLISTIKIKNIMTKKPITVPPDYTVEETAEVLLENKISGVPVVTPKGEVVGIITQSDLFRVLISLTGIGRGGLQFAFQSEDRPGSIKELADIIRKYGGRLSSILTSYENVPIGFRKVYIRAIGIAENKLKALGEELGRTAALLYIVNDQKNKREIFL